MREGVNHWGIHELQLTQGAALNNVGESGLHTHMLSYCTFRHVYVHAHPLKRI